MRRPFLLIGALALVAALCLPAMAQLDAQPINAHVELPKGQEYAIAGTNQQMMVYFESQIGPISVQNVTVHQTCANGEALERDYSVNTPNLAFDSFSTSFIADMPAGPSQCYFTGKFQFLDQTYSISTGFVYVAPKGANLLLSCNLQHNNAACAGELDAPTDDPKWEYDAGVVFRTPDWGLKRLDKYSLKHARSEQLTPGYIYDVPLNEQWSLALGPLGIGRNTVAILLGARLKGSIDDSWLIIAVKSVTVINGHMVYLPLAGKSSAPATGPTPTPPPEPTAKPTPPPEP